MAAKPGRAANYWLSYIRPHLRSYEALGRGERRDYIAKLSKKVELSDNTLRRFIAAAQFLEGEGIVELPPSVRMPVAAVERVARIAARQPERRRELLDEIARGKLTVLVLREMLKKGGKSAVRHQRARAPSNLEERVIQELEARRICKRGEARLTRADEDELWWLFATSMRPSLIAHLPRARRVLVIEDRASTASTASFALRRRELLRNILAGAALYEFVFVCASIWRSDVEKLVQAMSPAMRTHVILIGDGAREA